MSITRALGHSGDLRASLRRALECLRAGTGAPQCTVWLLRSDGAIDRAAYAGLTPEYRSAFDDVGEPGVREHLERSTGECTILDGEAVKTLFGPGFPAPYTILGVRSACSIPLITPRYRVGAVLLGHHEAGWFRRHSVEFYRALGEILASAIDNARLYEELRLSEERQTGLLRSAQDGIGCLDRRGRFTEANPAIEQILGRPREHVIGRRLFDFVPAAMHGALGMVFGALHEERARVSSVRLEVLHRSGAHVPVVANGSPLHGPDGEFQGIVFVVQDERERLAAEQQRERDVLRSLELMLEHLAEGVALVDAGTERLVSCNAAFTRLVGGSGGAVEGQPLAGVFPQYEASGCSALFRGCTRDGANRLATDIVVIPPGRAREYWTISMASLPAISEGRRLLLLTVSDTTSRRALDERLRQSQKLAAVGTLAGGIAHEYNNLLTTILGHLSIALADLPTDHPLAPGLRDSEEAALRAADLTRQLLGFGRRSPLEARPMQVARVIEDLLPLLRRTFGGKHSIRVEYAEESWGARLDPERLGEAIVHLCLNARDAMPGAGDIRIQVTNELVEADAHAAAGEYVRIDVRDTGVGMPPEVLARMYEPFYTTKGHEGGTGLGLATVHGIVDQHHGWIECESAPGRGTRFSVFLPRWKDRELVASDHAAASILVVDDEEAVRSLAKQALERRGFRVGTADDGVEALARIVAGERPDLVLLDMTMPHLSGADTLRRIRAIAPGIRVVLTTGYGAGSMAEAGLLADAFLPKPFTPDRLAELIREVLSLAR